MSKNLSKLDRAFIKIYREDALIEQHKKCCYCHEPLTFKTVTAEHKTAKSKNGSNARKNIAASCEPCNSIKGSMSDAEFKKVIKSFPTGRHFRFLLAWSRRRINLALDRLDGKFS